MKVSCTLPMVLFKKGVSSPIAKRGLFLFIGIVVIPLILFASHFRYGSISWQNTTGNTVVFKISQAWRLSFFFSGTPTIGSTVTTGVFNFGDGTSQTISLTVTTVNTAEDWFYGEATMTRTYTSPGTYTAYWESNARISTLQNNADGNYRVQTKVNVGNGNSSPVSTILPIINVPVNNASAPINIPAVDPNGTSLTYRFSTSSEAAGFFGSFVQPTGLSLDGTTGQMTFNTVGKSVGQLYSTQVMISDGAADVALDFIIKIVNAVVNNNPPVYDYTITPANGQVINATVGSATSFDIKTIDNDAGNTLSLTAVGVPVGATFTPALPVTTNPAQTQLTWTPTVAGSYVLTFNAVDNYGATANTSVTINVIANSISTGALSQSLLCPSATISIPYSATGVYNAGNIFTAQLSDGTGSFATPTNIGSATATSSGTISATVPSNIALGSGYRIRVVSSNPVVNGSNNGSNLIVEAAPTVSSLAPTTVEPVPIGTTVTVNATYSGNNLNVANINWGDGNIDNISTTNSHTYSSPGVYTVTATLTNNCNQSASKDYQYVVVYDPTAGFITGGGWINSPTGAYTEDPALTGKANFGFVSKYQKGQTKPSGNTQFEFHAAALDFKSTSYEWLVISGTTRGQFKGAGTINGSGNYGFLLSAVDGNETGGDGMDKFRIKIWNKDITTGNNVVYDNQMGDADDAVAATPIEGGSIVIHVPTKGKTTTIAVGVNDVVESVYDGKLVINALPNPSIGMFILKAQSGSTQSMQMRILDILGRVVETRSNISANTSVSLGNNYRPGIYYIEVVQGAERRMLKLVKQ